MLEDPSILKIGQNMKYDSKIFAQLGINVAPIDDTMLMSYAMHAGLHGHGMDTLSERYLGHTPLPIKPLLGSGKSAVTFDKVPRRRPAPPRAWLIYRQARGNARGAVAARGAFIALSIIS